MQMHFKSLYIMASYLCTNTCIKNIHCNTVSKAGDQAQGLFQDTILSWLVIYPCATCRTACMLLAKRNKVPVILQLWWQNPSYLQLMYILHWYHYKMKNDKYKKLLVAFETLPTCPWNFPQPFNCGHGMGLFWSHTRPDYSHVTINLQHVTSSKFVECYQ